MLCISHTHTLSLPLCCLALFPLLSVWYKNPWQTFWHHHWLQWTVKIHIVIVSLFTTIVCCQVRNFFLHKLFYHVSYSITYYWRVYVRYHLVLCRYHQASLSINIVQYICSMQQVVVKYYWYRQVLPRIVRAQKSILMILFLTEISPYFTLLLSDHQYRVLDQIWSEWICLKFSWCQTFDAYSREY